LSWAQVYLSGLPLEIMIRSAQVLVADEYTLA
jgi:hypothetical protein